MNQRRFSYLSGFCLACALLASLMAPCAAPEAPTSQATAVFNSYLAGVEARLDQQHRSQDSFHSQTAAEETALSDYRRVLEVNLIAPFLLAKNFEKGMLEGGSGSIVNAASVASLLGIADRVAYNATGSAHLCVRGLCRQDCGAGCRPGSDHFKLTRSHLTAHVVLCLPSVVLFGLSAAVAGSFPIYGQHKASWTIVAFDHGGFSLAERSIRGTKWRPRMLPLENAELLPKSQVFPRPDRGESETIA